ncbi:MAG: M1 family aminopeptidase [Polyangiales bacterium]
MRHALIFATLTACGASPTPTDASPQDLGATSRDVSSPQDLAPDVPAPTGPARVTVTRYAYTLDLATRALGATLTLRVDTPGDCLSLALQDAAPTNVQVDGVDARTPAVTDGVLRLCHPGAGFAQGSTPSITLQTVVPNESWRPTQVGYSQRNNSAGRRFTYYLSWVGQCGRVGPCDAAPSRFAHYRFTVTHPTGTEVLCPGTIARGDTETSCTFEHPGGPAYSAIGVMALSGGWRRTAIGDVGGVEIAVYDTTAARMADTLDRTHALGFLRWMTERFGRFPYGPSLRVVSAPTYWSGFEHPGNITIAETLVGNPALDHTYRHEVAHQWAGDLTTLATERDFVWKEAMAEYLAYVYEDENLPAEQAAQTLRRWRDAASRAARYPIPDEPLDLLAYYGSAYGPGPLVLFRQLEVMTSRRQVMEALRALLGRERALSVDDVRAALEASTGLSLERYLRVWLRGAGMPAWPAVDARTTVGADGAVTLTVDVQTADNVVRPCRFKVRLLSDGGRSLDVPVRVGDDATPRQTVVRPDFAVTGVEVDPTVEAMVFPAAMPDGARWVRRAPPALWDPFRAPDPPRR